MANVTQDLYPNAEEKNYVKVVFQRGRDVADAELNELQDIIRGHLAQQMRASKEEGIYGSGELLSVADGTSNDLTIRAGSFYIEGMRYQLAADELLSVLTADPISTPGADQMDAIALDFVEVEVSGVDDPAIVYSGLGETARRRQLSVTWRYLTDVSTYVDPYAPLPDAVFSGNTRQIILAYVKRYNGQAAINPGDVVDVRPRPISQQLAVDFDVAMLGTLSVASRVPTGVYTGLGQYSQPLFIRATRKWLAPGKHSNAASIAATSTGDHWRKIFTSADTNNVFTLIAKNTDESLIVAVGTDFDAGGDQGILAYSTDYGVTWTEVTAGAVLEGIRPASILYDAVHDVWLIGGFGNLTAKIITSTDPTDGASWVSRTTLGTSVVSLVATNTNIIAGTSAGGVLLATDPEGTWTAGPTIHSTKPVYQMAYDPAAEVVRAVTTDLVADTTTIWESTDEGTTWYEVLVLTPDQVFVYDEASADSGVDGFATIAGGDAVTSFFYIPESRLWVLTGGSNSPSFGSFGPTMVVIAGTSYVYVPVPGNRAQNSLTLGFDPAQGAVGSTLTAQVRANPRRVPFRL